MILMKAPRVDPLVFPADVPAPRALASHACELCLKQLFGSIQ